MIYEEWLDGKDCARLPDFKAGQIIRADKDFAFGYSGKIVPHETIGG